MENIATKEQQTPKPRAGAVEQQGAPVTYNLEGRTYIVKPVFKEKPAQTLSDALLRLMRSDLETS